MRELLYSSAAANRLGRTSLVTNNGSGNYFAKAVRHRQQRLRHSNYKKHKEVAEEFGGEEKEEEEEE